MTFHGIPAQQLLTVGAVAGALTVVFYILKLRRRPVPVPFSRIWQRFLRDKEATSLFSQLKRLLSLLLQLVLLTLLLLALGDPRTAENLIEGRNVVVLLDASASMQATDADPTRLEAGKKKVRDMVRGLGGSDRMLIAQMDATITPLSTLTGDIPELESAVASVKPSDARADFARGLRFAADTLRGTHAPEIIVVSDGLLEEPRDAAGPVDLGDIKLSFVPLPGPIQKADLAEGTTRNRNVAITEFTVRRYPLNKSRYEVLLELTNTGATEENVELSLLGDGLVTEVTKLILKPHEPLKRFYPNLTGASRTLEARIQLADGTKDDLPADDHAFALLPERRRARVQRVSEGNLYLDAALLLDEYLEVENVTPDKYPLPGNWDVTIFDGVSPPVAPHSGNILYLDPKNENVPFEVGKEVVSTQDDMLGFDTVEANHPLLRHLNLSDVNIRSAHILKPPKEAEIVGASFKGPLLIAGRHGGQKYVALGFDPARSSDFIMRVAWPLFLLNTIDDFVEEDTSYISSFTTGNVWRVPASSSVDVATLTDPDGEKRTVPVDQGRAVYLGQRAGFYTLETAAEHKDDDPPPDPAAGAPALEQSMFAANLNDPHESEIDPRTFAAKSESKIGDATATVADAKTFEADPKRQPRLWYSEDTERYELAVNGKTSAPPSSFRVGVRREIWIYLLIAALILTAVEWMTYHRRVTV